MDNYKLTSKTRVIPRTLNGFQKVYLWCSLVEEQAKFGERATHCLGKTVLHTCSDLFKPGQNFSHLFPHVPTCSQLFKLVHICSHLFKPVHTCSHLGDYLRSSRNGSFSLNFPLAKAVLFRSEVLSC